MHFLVAQMFSVIRIMGVTSTKKIHLSSYLYSAHVILSWNGKNRFERSTYNVHQILMNV